MEPGIWDIGVFGPFAIACTDYKMPVSYDKRDPYYSLVLGQKVINE